MNRKHLHGALLLAAVSLLATGAYADPPSTPPGKATAAAAAADKGGDKGKADKAKDGKDSNEAATPGKAKSVEDRAARKAKQHGEQREKLSGMLKAPMSEAFKQELRRHAERLARLERIKEVAQTEKDTDTADKATKLIAKENDRHDKWMSKSIPGTGAPAAVEAAKDGGK